MNDLAVIHLTNGGFTVVNAEDSETLSGRRWRRNSKGHIIHQWWSMDSQGNRVKLHTEWMHRTINSTPDGMETDHRNGVKLDNRRCNLRDATHGANSANKPKNPRLCVASVFKGVGFNKISRVWYARIKKGGKVVTVCAKTERDAAAIYNALATEHFGEFARLNVIT